MRCISFTLAGPTLHVRGFATLGVNNGDLMAAMARRILQEDFLATFNAQEIANTVWVSDYVH